MPQSRLLAAIMVADVDGYTAMMQENEVLAMQVRASSKKYWKKKLPLIGANT